MILPNGHVMLVGGDWDTVHHQASAVVLAAEIYNPLTNTWIALAECKVPRQYHAVALLLPDGRVWSAGSQYQCDGGLHTRELRIEVFSPPYLFWGPRPTVSSAPAAITPSTSGAFTVSTPQAGSITSATLVRCGSTTHGFDADQRCLELAILSRSSSAITLSLPPDNAVAPPGPYFLFIFTANQVPSLGHAIRVNVA